MDILKRCITSAPVLRFPDFTFPFFVHADAFDPGLGAALMQKDAEGREVVEAYASQSLHKAEKPYSTPAKECLAVIWALEHFRPYRLHRQQPQVAYVPPKPLRPTSPLVTTTSRF